MLVTVVYQYKNSGGSLRGSKDIVVKGSGSAVDKATKQFLNWFSEKKEPGDVYLLRVSVRG